MLSTTHPVRVALAMHAQTCSDLHIRSIVGQPEAEDAYSLAAELMAFAASVDRVVLAFGEYGQSHLGLSAETIDRHFRDQLRNALEGNATYEIEANAEATENEYAERDPLQRMYDACRGPR